MAQVATGFLFPDPRASWGRIWRRRIWPHASRVPLPQRPPDSDEQHPVADEAAGDDPREAGSVVVEFDLTGMDDEIAILSGRPDTAALMEQIAVELGPNATVDDRSPNSRHGGGRCTASPG